MILDRSADLRLPVCFEVMGQSALELGTPRPSCLPFTSSEEGAFSWALKMY